ncbi:MAG: hypothetical protein QOI55_1421 [Actinomycetota bacterium]|nr:hypothetical protein [Actinomycetota bacterium]
MGADRGYFVRLAPPPNATPTAAGARAGLGGDGARPRRRRRHVHVPIGIVVVAIAGAWFVWAQVHEGGARKEIQHAIDDARGAVEHATTDPGLKRAAIYFGAQYARDGKYTKLSDAALRDDTAADWGVGVTVLWCNEQAMVLQSMTGAGAVSRLLLQGQDAGNALGEHGCPADVTNPIPWKPPAP